MQNWYIWTFVLASIGFVGIWEWRARKRIRDHLKGRPKLTPDEFGATYFSGRDAEIATFILRFLGEKTATNFAGLHPSDRFNEDLNPPSLDSLAAVTLLAELEDTYKISISDEEAQELTSVAKLVSLVARSCKQRMPNLGLRLEPDVVREKRRGEQRDRDQEALHADDYVRRARVDWCTLTAARRV